MLVGMAVDAQDPGNVRRYLTFEIDDRSAEIVQRLMTGGADLGFARIEQDRGFEDETVADHPDARPRAKDLAQAAEEIGAIARQFLHLLRQRGVQPGAEIGDLGLRVLARRLGSRERVLDRRQLAAQRRYLLLENIDLRECPRRNILLRFERQRRRRSLAAGLLG